MSSPRPHDRSQRLLFGHASVVRDLIDGFVRGPWSDELDLSTLEPVPADFVSGDLPGTFEERQSDLVWKARWRDRDLFVLILLELQSTSDRHMALRMGTYVLLLYQRLGRAKVVRRGAPLPPVLPVVFYNGEAPWSAPVQLAELIHSVPESLSRFRPSMSYFVVDAHHWPLATRRPEDEESENILATLIAIEQLAEHGPLGELAAQLFDRARNKPESETLIRDLLAWLRKAFLPSRFPSLPVPEIESPDAFTTFWSRDMQTWEEVIKTRALEKGIEEGIEKGQREGLHRGRGDALLSLIRIKFGDAAVGIATKRIREAKVDELESWTERLLSADSLEKLFGGERDES